MPKADKKSTQQPASRITFSNGKAEKVAITKLPKEEVAKAYAEAVLRANDSVLADIAKTGRGKCMLVRFSGIESYAVLAFVFSQDHIIVSAEYTGSEAPLFNTLKRTYDSVETAAKFTRLAFIKEKEEAAKAVPTKPPRGRNQTVQEDDVNEQTVA